MPRVRAATLLASLLLVALGGVGCASSGDDSTPQPTVDTGAVPPEDQPDRERFDFGDTVVIEDERVVPIRLGAAVDTYVRFVNNTHGEVSLRFSGSLDGSEQLDVGPIPPGQTLKIGTRFVGQFTYTVTPEPARVGAIEVATVEGLTREPGQ